MHKPVGAHRTYPLPSCGVHGFRSLGGSPYTPHPCPLHSFHPSPCLPVPRPVLQPQQVHAHAALNTHRTHPIRTPLVLPYLQISFPPLPAWRCPHPKYCTSLPSPFPTISYAGSSPAPSPTVVSPTLTPTHHLARAVPLLMRTPCPLPNHPLSPPLSLALAPPPCARRPVYPEQHPTAHRPSAAPAVSTTPRPPPNARLLRCGPLLSVGARISGIYRQRPLNHCSRPCSSLCTSLCGSAGLACRMHDTVTPQRTHRSLAVP